MHQAQTYSLTMAPYAANKEEKKKKLIWKNIFPVVE